MDGETLINLVIKKTIEQKEGTSALTEVRDGKITTHHNCITNQSKSELRGPCESFV